MPVENHVKKFRERKDITQEELARKIGVSRQTINAIETGKYNPSLELALQIAEFFGAKFEEIFILKE